MEIPHINIYKEIIILVILAVIIYLLFIEKKISLRDKLILSIPVIPFGFLGARIFFLLENQYTININNVFNMHFTNYKGFGAFAFITIAVFITGKLSHIKVTKYLEVFTKSFFIGGIFAKIGCLFAGCCKGKVTNLPWAIHRQYDIAPVHPAEIYDMLNFIISLLILRIMKDKVTDNQRLAIALIVYVVIRSLIEATYYHGQIFGSTFTRIVNLTTIIICLVIIIKETKKK